MLIEEKEAQRVLKSEQISFSYLWNFLDEDVPEAIGGVGSKIEKNYVPAIIVIMIFAFVIHLSVFHPNSNVANDTISKVYLSDHFYDTGEYLGTHYMPVYPLLLGLTGTGEYNIHLVQMAFLEILIFLTFFVGSHFNRKVGLLSALMVAINAQYLRLMESGGEELLVAILLLLVLYGILRGIKDSNWMIFAAVFAGLAYLTKASTGYIFIIGGVCGFAWRFYYDKWNVFRERGYVVGIIIFLVIVGAWTLRNLIEYEVLLGSPSITRMFSALFQETPTTQGFVVGGLFIMFIIYALYKIIWFAPDLFYIAKNSLKNQEYGAVLLFIVTTFLIASIVGAAFMVGEEHNLSDAPAYLRYVSVVDTMVFMLIGIAIFRTKVKRRHLIGILLAVLILSRWYLIANEAVYEKSTLVKSIDVVNEVNQTTVYTNEYAELEYFGTPHEIQIITPSEIQDLPNGSLVFIYEKTDEHYTDNYLFKEYADNGYFKVFYKGT